MKKYSFIFSIWLIALLFFCCQREDITKNEQESITENIKQISLQKVPIPVKNQLKEHLKNQNGYFSFLEDEVSVVTTEQGLQTYAFELKKGTDIQSIAKHPQVMELRNDDCNSLSKLGADMVIYETIVINVKDNIMGGPTHVYSENHGDFIKSTFTNMNTGVSTTSWTANTFSPTFSKNNNHFRGSNRNLLGNIFNNVWSRIE